MAEDEGNPPIKAEKSPAQAEGLSAWRPFDALHKEVDRVFSDFTRGLPSPLLGRRWFDIEPFWHWDAKAGAMAPAVDVVEKDSCYLITAELPGLDEKNIEVTLSGDILVIKGEKKDEKEEKDKSHYMSERRYGSFRRSFQLPKTVDQGKIEASFQKGVLTVTLPKGPDAKSKETRIAVKSK